MAKRILHGLFLAICLVRVLPALAVVRLCGKRDVVRADLGRWIPNGGPVRKGLGGAFDFANIMGRHLEFRSLVYFRLGPWGKVLQHLMKPMSHLYLFGDIGPGLFIEHGCCTLVGVRKMGANCWINQQVSVGWAHDDCPTIGQNVRIHAGAKVMGGVTVGDNCTIGANAVVVKNVPPNCTVVGVPAYIVRRDGVRVTQPLT
jgi:serine O-acetyltransferase